jgi:hypothetical protein
VPEDLSSDAAGDPQTAAGRWQTQIEGIFQSEFRFTNARLRMESSVDVLTLVAVLGVRGALSAYAGTGQSVAGVVKVGGELMDALDAIVALNVAGEPSESNNLDTYVAANKNRLQALITDLKSKLQLKPGSEPGSAEVDVLETAVANAEEFRQVIDLARRFCDAQLQALLNKLSRAYQKPDFCIWRDAVGAGKNSLLPMSLSWDGNWYYGNQIKL